MVAGLSCYLDSAKPCQIFGIDNDPIAVMLVKFNLLLKFRNESFTPQIFCSDYISQLIVVMSLFGLQFGAIKSDIGFYPMMERTTSIILKVNIAAMLVRVSYGLKKLA